MFFLPDTNADAIENLFGYCLAHAANQFGIQVHASVMMSNHHHTDITDPHGQIVRFKQLFHSLLARGINVLRGRFDAVWSRDRPCDTRRSTEDESINDLVYTLTNPVKAGLVKWSGQWTGFTTHGWRFGEPRTFKRPDFLFDAENMPATVELTLQRPPICPELTDDEFFELLTAATRAREQQHHEEHRRSSRGFMGARKVQRQRWDAMPQSPEHRFTRTPNVAASSRWLVLAELKRDRVWERTYAGARNALLAGKDTLFPAGTYWLRHFAGVAVCGP